MFYYVSCGAEGKGNGAKESPFQTIQEAADLARPGDEIIVTPGRYREWVNPNYSGSQELPIIYRAEVAGMSTITGAERMENWKYCEGDVWKTTISNDFFGDYNPYTTMLGGDWYYTGKILHTGEVYINGRSMYETDVLEEVFSPLPSEISQDKDFSIYQWYTTQDNQETIIYGNFHGTNPNEAFTEINVRRNCFYPVETGINYITVSGFYMKQAATTWAPPTAYQDGLIGPHWSKGWIIEECEISDSKCAGISIGKYLQPNNENKWTVKRLKQGTQTERDAICQALLDGWTKEKIGSHTIRRCRIHDCEQAGIVGHLGGAFSTIEDNVIYDINKKRQITGAEIAGVKLHAAIDVRFLRNHIHHCTRGLWLDWQAQGTRVSGNFFHHNFPASDHCQCSTPLDIGEDLFIEISHGPTLVDHNLFLSPQACRLATQGIAFIHNLICGSFTSIGTGSDNVSGIETANGDMNVETNAGPRYTPYHVPHQTELAGFMTILHGDCRFYNNIFVQKDMPHIHDMLYQALSLPSQNSVVGTISYHGFPTEEEYLQLFFSEKDSKLTESRIKYYSKLPVYTGGNIFFNGAKPWEKEQNFIERTDIRVNIEIRETEDGYFLETDMGGFLTQFETPFISTDFLGEAFEPEQKFENPDGSRILFDKDYFGFARGVHPVPGPFETKEGWNIQLSRL